MSRVLVTGAGGFAGSHIARYLRSKGHEVIGTIRRKREELDFPVVICDLAESIEIDANFDVIVHCAGSLPYKETDFRQFKRNNIDTMEQLVGFAVAKRVKRFINLSTIGIYGEFHNETITEEADRINPDAYGLTKYIAECILRAESSLESISLRMPGIIGPGSRGVWFTNTVEKFKRGETVTIYSPDFETKNFVWIGDLTRFIWELIDKDNWQYEAVNLACSESSSIRKLVQEMKRLTDSSSEIIVAAGNRAPFCLDNTRAEEMGYKSLSPMEIVKKFIEGL